MAITIINSTKSFIHDLFTCGKGASEMPIKICGRFTYHSTDIKKPAEAGFLS